MVENSDKRRGQRWPRRVAVTGATIVLGLALTTQQALAATHIELGGPAALPPGQTSAGSGALISVSGLTRGTDLALPQQLAILDALSQVVARAAARLAPSSPAGPVLVVNSGVGGQGLTVGSQNLGPVVGHAGLHVR